MNRRGPLVRWLVVAPLVLGVGLSCLSGLQRQIDGAREEAVGQDELLYLPNEKLLDHFTCGFSSVIADVLWLRCIQYTVSEFHNPERKFTWLEHMCQTIARLDPHFVGAYQYGGMLLAAIDADEAGLKLLRQGLVNRPDTWELPFETAKIYVLNRRDEPGSPAMASYYLALAGRDSDHPEYFLEWAQAIQLRHNLAEDGRRIWEGLLATTSDGFMRELAERKLQELNLHEAVDTLNRISEEYEKRVGRKATRFEDFEAAGLITGHPTDPLGGEFLLDADGRVRNTTLMDMSVDRRLRKLRAAVAAFEKDTGRWPTTLEELAPSDLLKSVPDHPYPGRQWDYEPATGKIGG